MSRTERWDAGMIAEGCALVERALSTRRFGPYCLQAAIAAVHAEAPSVQTDWRRLSGCMTCCARRAVAGDRVEPRRGPGQAGWAAGRAGAGRGILDRGELQDYHLAHSARAEFCRQLGRVEQARQAYRRALELTRQEPERRFIEGRLSELD
jgi:RNA polymerase sigma-70 factor (ECF subfamily)